MKAVLIRHGQTQWNSKNLIQGRRDSPVTALGSQQSMALIAALAAQGIRPGCVFSSPAGRAQHMAARIADHFACTLALREALHEQSFGRYEGRLRQDYPFIGEANAVPPEGESLMCAAQRLMHFLQELPQHCAHDTVALVSHGQVMQAAIAYYCENSLENVARYYHPNASFAVLDVTEAQCRVMRWGVATHLLTLGGGIG
ncbi:histidine phosphatase family protein [Vagococcus sp. WN89Y]|uniref:histidine phosphatase family protein n=1 Tax=Vagococcus sp. WN89Y TaxID=3457258 RepID=UPI003FCDBE4A